MNRNDYLMHYGVKGMKWGVRHEPERVGSFRRFRTDANGGSSSRRGLTDKQKTAVKMAAGAAFVVGGSVLAYKMNKRLVATGGRATKALANKQAMKIAAKDPRVGNSARTYSRFVKKSRGTFTSGTKIRSTSGHLTGHSSVVDKRGAAQHRARFYDKAKVTYQNRFNSSLNGRAPTDMQRFKYQFNNNILESNRSNALDQLKYTPSRGVSSPIPRKLRRP